MQLQVETETAKELLRLEIQILGIPVQAMHFFLLTVSWEPINVAYIIRKSCGHTWPENTLVTSQPSLGEHFQRELWVLLIFLLLFGFLVSPWED